jgi:putative chitinase
LEPAELLIPAKTFKVLFPALQPLALAGYPVPLHRAMAERSIDTVKRVAAFVAQIGHESQGLTRWVESFNYSPERLAVVFRKYFPTLEEAAAACARGPVAIANIVYGGRNGNVEPGDGWRYRGRGPTGLTFRGNYRVAGAELGEPLEENPDLVATPPVGFRTATWFWESHGCNQLADVDDFRAITRAINGGMNGWDDRLRRWRLAQEVFGLPAPPADAEPA